MHTLNVNLCTENLCWRIILALYNWIFSARLKDLTICTGTLRFNTALLEPSVDFELKCIHQILPPRVDVNLRTKNLCWRIILALCNWIFSVHLKDLTIYTVQQEPCVLTLPSRSRLWTLSWTSKWTSPVASVFCIPRNPRPMSRTGKGV